jgi:transcriptional regulator GlxA family with amidase domain
MSRPALMPALVRMRPAASCTTQRGPATTHWEDQDDLRRAFPALDVQAGPRWVVHDAAGRILTSAGISAGLDMSLHLVARLSGAELAQRTARQMDYAWQPGP